MRETMRYAVPTARALSGVARVQATLLAAQELYERTGHLRSGMLLTMVRPHCIPLIRWLCIFPSRVSSLNQT
jgi:hypothetical protein